MDRKINQIIEQLRAMGYDDDKISNYFDNQYDILKQNKEELKKQVDARYDEKSVKDDLCKFNRQQAEMYIENLDTQQTKVYDDQINHISKR
jgi:hypothetical protein